LVRQRPVEAPTPHQPTDRIVPPLFHAACDLFPSARGCSGIRGELPEGRACGQGDWSTVVRHTTLSRVASGPESAPNSGSRRMTTLETLPTPPQASWGGPGTGGPHYAHRQSESQPTASVRSDRRNPVLLSCSPG